MVEYKCFRCGYIAKQKCNLITHLKRKNICLPKNDDVSIESIINYYGFEQQIKPGLEQGKPTFNSFDATGKNQEKPAFEKNAAGKKQAKPAFSENDGKVCSFCGKCFTRTYGLTTHLKICKQKKNQESMIEEKNNEIKELKGMVEKLLIEKTQYNNPTVNNNHNSTVNNTDNSTTINVISLNNYGSEDTQYITKEYLMGLLEKPFKSIPELIKYTHFNKEHPENQNIKLPNKKEPYVKILKDNKWQLVDRKDTINDLIDQKHSILNNIDIKSNFEQNVKDRIETFNDKYLNDDKELVNKLYKDSELVLINNS